MPRPRAWSRLKRPRPPPSRTAQGAPDDAREDEEKAIEATKAPLMDHLIELRSRLIKALAAFAIAAMVCFFFAKQIYNVLTWPYIWVAGPENSKFIYTGLLEYFIVQLKLAMFGAAFIAFPVIAGADLHVRRARALSQREGRRSCLTSSPRRSFS